MTEDEGEREETGSEEPDLTDWDETDTTHNEELEFVKKGLKFPRKENK